MSFWGWLLGFVAAVLGALLWIKAHEIRAHERSWLSATKLLVFLGVWWIVVGSIVFGWRSLLDGVVVRPQAARNALDVGGALLICLLAALAVYPARSRLTDWIKGARLKGAP